VKRAAEPARTRGKQPETPPNRRAFQLSSETIAVGLVCVAAAAIYLSLIRAPFLSWDDDRNIAANPYYLHLGWWRLWLAPYFGMFVPVTSSAWAALLYSSDGAAWSFRAFNVALHVANTVLVWRLIVVLAPRVAPDSSGARRSSATALAVAIFALHPLQSAAVAWISGGRDLLAATFGLGALILLARESRRSYAIATLLFAAGLLSKPSIAALPLAVIVFVAMFERARLRLAAMMMAGWILLVAAVAIGTAVVQSDMVAAQSSLLERPLIVLDAAGFYLGKLAWPASLSVDYGRTPAWLGTHLVAAIPTVAALLAAVIVVWWSAKRRGEYRIAALWLVLIAPVLGAVPFAFQRISTVADHYAYFPMVIVALVAFLTVKNVVTNRWVGWATAGVFALVASLATWQRVAVWRSDEALFTDALAKNPSSFVALNNLAKSACTHADFARGLDLAERALRLQPTETPALVNKAYCLYHSGEMVEVVELRGAFADSAVQANLDRNSEAASAFANIIAGAMFQTGRMRQGWTLLCQAIALNPYDDNLRQNARDVSQSMGNASPAPSCDHRFSWRELAD
jgi:hypothetical protein